MKSCPYCGARYGDDVAACPADGHALDNPAGSPVATLDKVGEPKVRCPKCGAADDFTPAADLRGSFSWPVFFAGGILAVLFRNAGRERRVRCNQCDALFGARAPLSKVSLVIFWLLVCPTIIVLVVLLGVLLLAIFSH